MDAGDNKDSTEDMNAEVWAGLASRPTKRPALKLLPISNISLNSLLHMRAHQHIHNKLVTVPSLPCGGWNIEVRVFLRGRRYL